jgi:hypothetical protein
VNETPFHDCEAEGSKQKDLRLRSCDHPQKRKKADRHQSRHRKEDTFPVVDDVIHDSLRNFKFSKFRPLNVMATLCLLLAAKAPRPCVAHDRDWK